MGEMITHAAGIQLQPIKNDMLSAFVAYIDRSEKTTRTYMTNLRQFMAWTRYTGTDQPQRADIILYREHLTREHEAIKLDAHSPAGWTYRTDAAGNRLIITCKPNTIAQYLRSVCQFFRWTAANNLYPDIAANIHSPKLTHEHHKKDALTADEVQTIERHIIEAGRRAADGEPGRHAEQNKRLHAMFLLSVTAGLRTIEISRANVRDIQTKGGLSFICIWGKGHAEADTKLPIAPEVRAAIDDYIRCRTDRPTGGSPLFVATGNRSGGKRIAATTISTLLKRAMQEAGFDSERITAHSLRHTAGNNVRILTGNNIYETQKYMRHSNPATTEIYMHDGEQEAEQQADIAQRLYNHYHGIGAADDTRAQLDAIISSMTAAQLDKLTDIARTMKGV